MRNTQYSPKLLASHPKSTSHVILKFSYSSFCVFISPNTMHMFSSLSQLISVYLTSIITCMYFKKGVQCYNSQMQN